MSGGFTITPHWADQQNINHHGRRVGYCGIRNDQPISFLVDEQCKLTPSEKTDAIAYVIATLGGANQSQQTFPYWPKNDDEQREWSGTQPG